MMEWQWQPSGESASALLALAQNATESDPKSARSWLVRANLLAELGRQDEVIDVLTTGLENCPDSSVLHLALAGALATAGRYEAALAECDAVLDGRPETEAVLLLRFFLLTKLSRYAEATMLLERVMEINPCEPYIFELLGHDMRTADDAQRTLDACEAALSANRCCTNAIYFKAFCLAKLGRNAEAEEVLSLDRGIRIRDLEMPRPAAAEGEFLQALANEICAHPGLMPDPRGKSTDDGRQTPPLAPTSGPAIAALIDLIQEEVAAYAPQDAQCVPTKAKLHVWAVVCGASGRQRSHKHPDGWLSGVFYVRAPKSGGTYQGPLLLGALDPSSGVQPPWGIRSIEPVPGRLALFPSYVPHATEPSGCAGDRISVAFDVVPA